MKPAVKKRQTEKDASKVKDRRQGVGAGEKEKVVSAVKRAGACQKGESGRSIYTMALMTSKYMMQGGVIAEIYWCNHL